MSKFEGNKYYTKLGDEYDFMCENGIKPIGIEFSNDDIYPMWFVYAVDQELLDAIKEYEIEIEKHDMLV